MKNEKIIKEAIRLGLVKGEELEESVKKEVIEELQNRGYVIEKVYGTDHYLVDEDELAD